MLIIKNYLQRAELTKEEQIELYMKLPKKKLVEMLIECNRVINELTAVKSSPEPYPEVNMIELEELERRLDNALDFFNKIK